MNRILVAVDASPRARDVLTAAVELARQSNAKIELMRAVGLPPELPGTMWGAPQTAVVDSFMVTAKRDLEELATHVPAELYAGATTEVGVPWDAICSVAREHDADLIVIGSHGYSFVDRILGTTAAKVVNHAGCPVLVVRPKEKRQAAA